MDRLRGALRTFWSIVTHPLGHGSPIPLREKFDDHALAAVGRDDEAEKWVKAHAPKFRQLPRRRVA